MKKIILLTMLVISSTFAIDLNLQSKKSWSVFTEDSSSFVFLDTVVQEEERLFFQNKNESFTFQTSVYYKYENNVLKFYKTPEMKKSFEEWKVEKQLTNSLIKDFKYLIKNKKGSENKNLIIQYIN